MWRILSFFALVLALGIGFAWLADRPGDIVFTFDGMRYRIPLMVAASLAVALVATAMLAWWVVKSVVASPTAWRRRQRARKRDRGYQSLSTGLIAAGAGDAAAARRMTKQAEKLLNADQEPLIHLLDAQASMLEGRADDARAKFEKMVEDPETRLLGLRGLYLEAQRLGEREAAYHYAERAAETAPQLEWASSAVLGNRTAEGDWDGALKLLDAQKAAKLSDKDTIKRERAAVLTAKAMATLDHDAAEARRIGLEAHKLAPDLIPTSIVTARALLQQGELRKAAKILETAWKTEPHPEIAEVYVHARVGDSPADRLKRARQLFALRPDHPESSLALAHAALDAGEYGVAREAVDAVLKAAPRESAYLLMADIEEAQTGDQGRVRQWLSRAVKAPRDPAWTADGFVSDKWGPASPVTGRLNAFEWKVPVERLGPAIDAGSARDDDLPARKTASPAPIIASKPEETIEFAEAEVVSVEKPLVEAPVERETDVPKQVTPRRVAAVADREAKRDEIVIPVPDDPGVAPDRQIEKEPGRFRLF
ncbi:MAG: heme biosynthesis protein HemY [Phyllobacterium sp.]